VGSRYNPRLSIIDNIQLPPTLLSRFDLIYLVLDKADEASDRKLARHLVAMYHATPPANAQVLGTAAVLCLPVISTMRCHIHARVMLDAAWYQSYSSHTFAVTKAQTHFTGQEHLDKTPPQHRAFSVHGPAVRLWVPVCSK